MIGITVGEQSLITKGQNSYLAWVERFGEKAVLIAPGTELPFDGLVRQFQGIILSGGGDIHPRYLNLPDDMEGLEEVDPDRDWLEIGIVQTALAQNVPLLGICRGLQVLNVACGGSLFLDLARDYPGYRGGHQCLPGGRDAFHPVRIWKGTRAGEFFPPVMRVNSNHHQAVRDIGRGLAVSGRSPDGVVESIEAEKGWAIGVQWHPERLGDSPGGAALAKAFLARCASSYIG